MECKRVCQICGKTAGYYKTNIQICDSCIEKLIKKYGEEL